MDTNEARRALRAITKQLSAAKHLEEALQYQEQCEGRVRELDELIATRDKTLARLTKNIEARQLEREKAEETLRRRKAEIDAEIKHAEAEASERKKTAESEADKAILQCEEELAERRRVIEGRIERLKTQEKEAEQRAQRARDKFEAFQREVAGNG